MYKISSLSSIFCKPINKKGPCHAIQRIPEIRPPPPALVDKEALEPLVQEIRDALPALDREVEAVERQPRWNGSVVITYNALRAHTSRRWINDLREKLEAWENTNAPTEGLVRGIGINAAYLVADMPISWSNAVMLGRGKRYIEAPCAGVISYATINRLLDASGAKDAFIQGDKCWSRDAGAGYVRWGGDPWVEELPDWNRASLEASGHVPGFGPKDSESRAALEHSG